MTVVLPRPDEPIIDTKTGRVTESWYRYLSEGQLSLNSASSVTTAISTYGATIIAATTASVVRNLIGSPSHTAGTWTPKVAINGSTVGVTYATQIGRYIKQDGRVDLFARLVLTSNGAGTGSATVVGFASTPGIPTTVADIAFVGNVGRNLNIASTEFGTLECALMTTATAIELRGKSFGAVGSNSTGLTDSHVTDTADFALSITYLTS